MFKSVPAQNMPKFETMSLIELQQQLEQVNQKIARLDRGFVPKRFCMDTINKYTSQKQAIEAEIERLQVSSVLPTHSPNH